MAPTVRSDVPSLIQQFHAASNGQDPRASDAIATQLRGLIDDCLYLPWFAQSYRDDCLQELTFGLYDVLRRWHADGRLEGLRSLTAFARHYVRWQTPSVASRLAFRVASDGAPQHAVSEQDIGEGIALHDLPLSGTASGCHHEQRRARMGDGATAQTEFGIYLESLSALERRIVELADEGLAGRRRIEMAVVEEFGLTHRQARRALDDLSSRLRG